MGSELPSIEQRIAAIREWCAANASRYVRLSDTESFEAMVADVRERFYPDYGLWHMEADGVHQLVLRALADARSGAGGH